jgi:hypothetical protein
MAHRGSEDRRPDESGHSPGADPHLNPGMMLGTLDRVAHEVYGCPYLSLASGTWDGWTASEQPAAARMHAVGGCRRHPPPPSQPTPARALYHYSCAALPPPPLQTSA